MFDDDEVVSVPEPSAALKAALVEVSGGLPWDIAIRKMDVVYLSQDFDRSGVCVCGKTGLVWLYLIQHTETGGHLFPIGSDCINYFGTDAMADQAKDLRRVYELTKLVQSGTRLRLKGEGRNLTKASLLALYEVGAFKPSQWNGGDPSADYEFLRRMFMQRSDMSQRQANKVSVLLKEVSDFLRDRPTDI